MAKVGVQLNCVVCGVPTDKFKRCGVSACEACKVTLPALYFLLFFIHEKNPFSQRFYLRNRKSNKTLTCESGTNQCFEKLKQLALRVLQTPNDMRKSCQRCRYKRCIDSGMGSKSPQPANLNALGIFASSEEATLSEVFLRTVTTAARQLLSDRQSVVPMNRSFRIT